MLSSDLLLTHFKSDLKIVVAACVSNYGVDAVLLHVLPDNTEKAFCHAACSLTSAEQIEKEALAISFAVKKFHRIPFGHHFTLFLAIVGLKESLPMFSSNRLQCWATILLGYDSAIQYQSITKMGQAEALSRLINSWTKEPEDKSSCPFPLSQGFTVCN
ncbi:unnamed protein product [Schistocephalus solidus]|uniref:RT_RNaseH_2 domain-containing protein n=1 Tax=Schistocephalus solidus TaxID=70667 RepID=A0A183SPX1_SCHSO|nr:unnamed protein product [Schistocephalus solidus]